MPLARETSPLRKEVEREILPPLEQQRCAATLSGRRKELDLFVLVEIEREKKK